MLDEMLEKIIQETIQQMQTAAGHYAHHKMVMFLMGSSNDNNALLYIEEEIGQVRVLNPQIAIDPTDHVLDNLIKQLFEVHGIKGGTRRSSITAKIEGQIRIMLDDGQFSIKVVYPENLAPELSSFQFTPETTDEMYIAHEDNAIIKMGEMYFADAQLIFVNDGVHSNAPPQRYDLRTKAPVTWPETKLDL